jgi:hypothetical protein
MIRVLSAALLVLATCAVGCETGSQQENVTTTGVYGQKVGMNSNQKDGPVPGSTTGTVKKAQPAQQGQEAAPESAGHSGPPK